MTEVTQPQAGRDPTKVVGRRVVAYIVDVILMNAIAATVFLATANLTQIEGATDCAVYQRGNLGCFYTELNGKDSVFLFENRALLLAGLAALAYAVLFVWLVQGIGGWTPGKLLVGIRTVNEQGRGPGIGRSFIRWILMVVDGLCSGLVGLIAMLASKGHRRIGDMAAKTFVVRTHDRGRSVVVPGMVTSATAAPVVETAMPVAPPVAAPPPAEAGTAPTPPSGTPVAAGASADTGPRWDPQRNAYIQWDAARQVWLVFDDAAQEWKPLT